MPIAGTPSINGSLIHRGSSLGASAKPPLVVMMPHTGASGGETQTHWFEAADLYSLAVAITDGGPNNTTDPNGAGAGGGYPDKQGTVDHLKTMIPTWISALNADPNQVYLTGFSAGGTISQWAGAEGTLGRSVALDGFYLAGIMPGSGWNYTTTGFHRTVPCRFFATCGDQDVTGVEGSTTPAFDGLTTTGQQYADLNGPNGANVVVSTSGVVINHTWPAANSSQFMVVHLGGHCWSESWATGSGCHPPNVSSGVDQTDIFANWVLAGSPPPPPPPPTPGTSMLLTQVG